MFFINSNILSVNNIFNKNKDSNAKKIILHLYLIVKLITFILKYNWHHFNYIFNTYKQDNHGKVEELSLWESKHWLWIAYNGWQNRFHIATSRGIIKLSKQDAINN